MKSVYFGGGTPSLALPSTIAFIIQQIKLLFTTLKDVEITLEANPTVIQPIFMNLIDIRSIHLTEPQRN